LLLSLLLLLLLLIIVQRIKIKVADGLHTAEASTAMAELNLKVGFRVKPYCAESGHPITTVAISIMIRLLLLFVGTWLSNFLHLRHVTWLPESGVFIVFGLIYGSVILGIKGDSGALDLAFDATLLNLILLPPIIFYSGFSMHHSNFGANLNEILILAVVGTLVSTFGTGFGLHAMRDLGIGDFPSSINIYESLAFAALISAVDPVATLATFDALQVDPNVEVLIFGESLLNDAVAIVLYKSFAQFAERGGVTEDFGYTHALLSFVTLTFGSLLVGFGLTVLQALVFKFTFFKHTPVLEILMFMFLAYSSFIIAEYFHWSGIIASLGHGVGCALFVKPNMSQEGHFRAELISHSLAALADMLIFIMVGYSGVQTITSIFDVSWALTFATLLLCLMLRALSTFSMVPILNQCRKKHRKIGMNEAFLMWWSGLRGAIAIGLVAAIPSSLRSQMMSATCLIVFFTVFVLGGGTAAVLKKMGIKMGLNKPEAHGTLGDGCMKKIYKVMMKLLTNQDENDDGIDDRYQSTSYNREMVRRGSIVSQHGFDRSSTINVLQSDALKALQEKQDQESKAGSAKPEAFTKADAKESARATLNWE
jgi:sodium/hydrogen exchanger 8